jgi:hypothetical protein
MTKKQVYGGWWFNKTPAPVLAPAPAPTPTQSSTTLKDLDFYNALFGVDSKKFSDACESFKDQPVLNAVLGYIFNHSDVEGQTPLTSLIIKKNKLDFLNELLKTPGVDVNKQDNMGQTPLTMAVFLNRKDYVNSLLSANGIDVNRKNKSGKTPIFFASFDGNADILTMLIEKGGDVNEANKNGTTPLGIAMHKKEEAVVKQQEAVVEILEKNGAIDKYNEPPPQAIKYIPINGSSGYNQTQDGPKGGKKKSKSKSKTSTKEKFSNDDNLNDNKIFIMLPTSSTLNQKSIQILLPKLKNN